jgi:hypothetical protein
MCKATSAVSWIVRRRANCNSRSGVDDLREVDRGDVGVDGDSGVARGHGWENKQLKPGL